MGEKQENERRFHDAKFGGAHRRDFYAQGFTEPIFGGMMRRIGDITDKRVLELGCGEGWFTRHLARLGAQVWSFDISAEAVAIARSRLGQLDARHPVHLDTMTAEDLRYDPDSFDAVVGVAILHHLDLGRAVSEVHRVLRPGGRAYFMEPLGHNFVLNCFRRLTPGRRSPDERPLRREDLREMAGRFVTFEHEEYFLTAMLAAALSPLGSKTLLTRARDALCALDRVLLRAMPGLWSQCWYTVIECRK